MSQLITVNFKTTKSMAHDVIGALEKQLVEVENKYSLLENKSSDPWYIKETGHLQSMINELLKAQGLQIKY